MDGAVVAGASSIDESMLTGESVPVGKSAGDSVFAGTLNLDGAFTYRATEVGSATTLARITATVERAQASKAPVQRLADQIAGVFVPVVVLIAVITFIVWAVFGDGTSWTSAVLSAVAVLVVACPCALGLATPAAIAAGSGRAARLGILFRDAEALEAAGRIDAVAWDKTGTLTTGTHVVDSVEMISAGEAELIKLAASVERHSEHPLGEAIVAHAEEQGIELADVSDFRARPGNGATANVEGREIAVGNSRLMREMSIETTEADGPSTPVYVACDGELLGVIRLTDQLKNGAQDAVELLNRRDFEQALISGDTEARHPSHRQSRRDRAGARSGVADR